MHDPTDENAAIWQSETIVEAWRALSDDRTRQREQHWRLLADLLPFERDEAFTFLELGAGAGGATNVLLERYPSSRAVLADFSPPMIAEGERALAAYAGRFHYVIFDMSTDDWPEDLGAGFDAAITSQCLHHLDGDRKAAVIRGIAARLVPGAWYFNYDPVRSDDEVVAEHWRATSARADPTAAAHRHEKSAEEQARWDNHLRHVAPLAPQLTALTAAGFEGVDVYWRWLEDVIYGGRRPA